MVLDIESLLIINIIINIIKTPTSLNIQYIDIWR